MKYQKYIQTDLVLTESQKEGLAEYSQRATRILRIEDSIIQGTPSIVLTWYWKATDAEGTASHLHDFDEVIGFFGVNLQDPHDLGGEVEFWMEDEKYILTKSCFIFLPKGLRHCPLKVLRVDRPFLFLGVCMTGKYVKDGEIKANTQ